MKKIIALAMALVMMMAIAVPAFAGQLNASVQSGETTVVVDGTNGGTNEGTYSVTIPAAINLNWNDTEASDLYVINSQLTTGNVVKVTLQKAKDLTNTTNGTETIPFTVTDTTNGKARDEVVVNEEHKFDLAIDEDDWKKVSIAAYEGTITFGAEVVAA